MTLNKKVGLAAALSSMVFVSAVKADDGLKVGGFVDPQLQYTQTVGARSVLNDGAVYLTKSLGDGMAMIDLSFADLALFNGSLRSGSIIGGVAFLPNNLNNRSQAFVGYKYSNGFNWKFGQFDGIFGLEGNDTVDLFFASQGLVYDLVPIVHEALLVGYEISKSTNIQAYVGGSDGSGLAGATGAANPQIGAKFSYNDGLRLAVGGYMESERDVAEKSAMFLHGSVGMDFGSLALDAEYAMDTTGADDAAKTAMGLIATYGLSETTKFGVRADMLSNADRTKATGDNSEDSTMSVSVGPNFAMTKELNVKVNVNYEMVNSGVKDADAATTSSAVVAATYRF